MRGKGDEPCKLALCAEAMRGMQSEGYSRYTDRVDGISAGERTRAAAQRPREAKSVNGTERGRERERERDNVICQSVFDVRRNRDCSENVPGTE